MTGNVRILVINPKDEEDKRNAAAIQPESNLNQNASGDDTVRKLSNVGISNQVNEKSSLSPDITITTSKEVHDGKMPAKSPTKVDAKATTKTGGPIADAKSPAKKKDDNTIELKKEADGLGISIVGGTDTPLVNIWS